MQSTHTHTNSLENPIVIQEEMQDPSNSTFNQHQQQPIMQNNNNNDNNNNNIDPEKEREKKKVARGQRFGVNSVEDNTDTQQHHHHERRWDNKKKKRPHQPLSVDTPENFRVSANVVIEDEKFEGKVEQPAEVPRRMDALYLHGTDRMSTEDVFDIFVCGECDGCKQGVLCLVTPSKVEWINDSSCNAIFSTPEITLRIFTNADIILPTISQAYALHANTTNNTENDHTTQADTQIHSQTEIETQTQTQAQASFTTTQQTITDTPNPTLTPAEQILSSWRTKETSFGKISLRYATILDIRPNTPKPSLYYARLWNSKRNDNRNTKRTVFNHHKNNHGKKKNNNKKREDEDENGDENMEDDENVFITLDGQSQTTGSTPPNTDTTNTDTNANTTNKKKKKKKNKKNKNKKRKVATMDIDEGNNNNNNNNNNGNNNSQASEAQPTQMSENQIHTQTQDNLTTLTPTLLPSQPFQSIGAD